MAERRWEWIKRRGKRLTQGLGLLLTLCLLLALGGLLYLNRVGLPDFIKTPLLAELRARGLDVHFQRLRWHWYRGIVAEDLNLGRTGQPFGTQLYIDEAELRLDRQALKFFQFIPQALLAQGGRLTWQFPSPTNPTPARMTLDHIKVDLNFLPGDRWEIRMLQGVFEGSPIHLTGILTNASHLSRIKVAQSPDGTPKRPTALFDQLEAIIRQVQFRRPPAVSLVINADAKSPHAYDLKLNIDAPFAQSRWGSMRNFLLSATASGAAVTNSKPQLAWKLAADAVTTPTLTLNGCQFTGSLQVSAAQPYLDRAEIRLELQQAQTAWGNAGNVRFTLSSLPGGQTNRLTSELDLVAERIQTRWGQAARGRFQSRLDHALPFSPGSQAAGTTSSNASPALPEPPAPETHATGLDFFYRLTPVQAQSQLELGGLESSQGSLRQLSFTADTRFLPPSTAPSSITLIKKAVWLDSLVSSWRLQTDGLQSRQLTLPRLVLAGRWQSPRLELSQLNASLYGGSLALQAQLDASTRHLAADTQFDFNAHDLGPLLSTNSQRWLGQFGWKTPPKVSAQGSLTLPVLDGSPIDWRHQVMPTVRLQGHLQGTNCSYRRVQADAAQTHFILSNGVWNLPDLLVTRPEGNVELEYTSEVLSQDYHWVVRSRIDPKALRPLLEPGGNRALDLFEFTEPPWLEGHVWGRWQALPLLGVQANLTATNLAFRGGRWQGVRSEILFTNGVLQARQAEIWHNSGTAQLPLLLYDLPARLITFSNCTARLDPPAVTHAIGPQTEKAMSFYIFKQPPEVRVDGYLSVPKTTNVNMRFVVQGGPFDYWKFHFPLVNGEVNWRGDNLVLTNLTATFCRGLVKGNLAADFAPTNGTDLRFAAHVSNAELRDLMTDVATRTNSLEGNLSGVIEVDYANSSDWKSWQGKGSVQLQKGVIWDIPLFGILSPVLNTIHPGLGRSRFDQGTATYTIQNSVIHTKDLQIRSPALRLYYTGTVDFDGRVNAQAEASLFRDTPLLGPIFGLVFSPLTKLFVYKVTGTLGEPKKEPLYIPKPLQIILSPFKTIKELMPEGGKKPPPSAKPEPPSPSN